MMFTISKLKLSLWLIISFLLVVPLHGQVKDWGDVSRDELESTVYSADSSAAAVVLFDKAELDFNKDLEYEMRRHIRIKIFTEDGYDWATATLNFNDELEQDIRKVRGHTFVLNENGKIKKHKLDGDSIFEEEITNNFKQVKFTLPALKPGAIVEYKFEKHIGNPHMVPDWEFQKTIPVVWSEYLIKIPDWFFYNKLIMGSNPFHIQEEESFSQHFSYIIREERGHFTTSARSRMANIDIDGTKHRWVMKDLPAVKKLPYMTSVNDYKSKLWMQLTEIRIPGRNTQRFLKTWDDVGKELRKSDVFGGQLSSRSETEDMARQLTKGLDDDISKLRAIYEYVQESIVWDGTYAIFADEDISDVLKAKKGSSGSTNLLLTQLLRDAGLNADPVLLSTRSHGVVFDFSAIVNQFNHVISRVEIGEEVYLLDGISNNKFIDIFPANNLNGKGMVVGDEAIEWIALTPKTATKDKVIINAEINGKGAFDGKLYLLSQGYYASEKVARLKEVGEKEYIESYFLSDFENTEVDSFYVSSDAKGSSKLDLEVDFSDLSSANLQQVEGYLYLNPMLFLREKNNPFPVPDRKIPVDYPYTFEKEYVLNLAIPDGYSVEELPKPLRMSIPGQGIELSRIAQQSGNRVSLISRFSLKKSLFDPAEYQFLQEFYRLTVDAHNEQIVLKATGTDDNQGEQKP